jgi:restriction system protein
MIGAPIGASPIGAAWPSHITDTIAKSSEKAALTISSLIIPEAKTHEGILVKSTAHIWAEIVERLGKDWSVAGELNSRQWEELVAGAFQKAGFDEVILTPQSGDHGRDVIAKKKGIGSIKILGSVKANKPGNLVSYDDVRALIGVITAERDVSKGIITTTSDFPPKIIEDPNIAPFLPTRLELMNGVALQSWLRDLCK